MKLSYLWRGLPGHPLHPPLTDATIGIYTFATLAGLVEVVGLTDQNGAIGWWLGLVFGLVATVPTALAGLADWLTIAWRSEPWWAAIWHLLAMVGTAVVCGLWAVFGQAAYTHAGGSACDFGLACDGS